MIRRFALAGLLLLAPLSAALGTTLTVRYLDVGQGDSELLQWPNHAVLIDGGPASASSTLVKDLKRYHVTKLDWVIASHPHEDHIGGLPSAIPTVKVLHVLDSGYNHGSPVQTSYLRAVKASGADFRVPTPGTAIDLGGGVKAVVLAPYKPYEANPNNNSLVVRITFGTSRFLFPGDMQGEERSTIYAHPADAALLRADVLKVAHHGSRNGTDSAFLMRVKPRYAVISCGLHNNYGHPTAEALADLKSAKAKVFRTDQQGDITITTDGSRINVQTTHAATKSAVRFVGSHPSETLRHPSRTAPVPVPVAAGVKVWVNLNSGIYHYPGTRWYGNTSNGEFLSESEARKKGYRAALNGQ